MALLLRGITLVMVSNILAGLFMSSTGNNQPPTPTSDSLSTNGATPKDPTSPSSPDDGLLTMLFGNKKVNHFATSVRAIAPYMTEGDLMYFQIDIVETKDSEKVESPFDDGAVMTLDPAVSFYPSLSSGESLPTPEPEEHTDFLNRLIRPRLSSAIYEDKQIVRQLLQDRAEQLIATQNEVLMPQIEDDSSEEKRKEGDGIVNPHPKLATGPAGEENFFPFTLKQPVRNISKILNLTSCLARNCSLVAKVQVYFQHPTIGAYGLGTDKVARRAISFEIPLITFVEKIETEMVSLMGGEVDKEEEEGNKDTTPSDVLTVAGNFPINAEGTPTKKRKGSVKLRTKRSRTKIDSAIDSALQWAREIVVGSPEDSSILTDVPTEDRGEVATGVGKEVAMPSTDASDNGAEGEKTKFVQVFKPTLTLSPIVDFTRFGISEVPPQISRFYEPVTDPSPTPAERARALYRSYGPHMVPSDRNLMERSVVLDSNLIGTELYKPIVFVNNFWELEEHLLVLNETNAGAVPFTLSIEPLSLPRFLFYSNFDESFARQEEWGSMTRHDRDLLKKIALESNILLLVLTAIVSTLHSIFEMLAIKNDVSFWRNRKNYNGLSLRTIAVNFYFQIVIFLYLLDSEETSYMILIPAGINVLVEAWKLRKTMHLERDPITKRLKLRFNSTYDEKTRSYDQQAMRYLTYLLIPCLAGYSIYTAIYHEHKGWYSFLVTTQVRFIYFSGFIMMTPQIFINYKLKSVTAVPWRTFVYRFLNTIVDDLFAFVITMPTLHRIACFRDDVVFVILLVQRWKYPVDKNRTEDGYRDPEELEGESQTATTKAITGSSPVSPTRNTMPAATSGAETATGHIGATTAGDTFLPQTLQPQTHAIDSATDNDNKSTVTRRRPVMKEDR